jgi:hypothetical protein
MVYQCTTEESERALNLILRSRLLEMLALDERTRARLVETGELFAGYAPAMEDVHCRNADAMEDRIRFTVGWL